jgi:uncharacterized protein (TIGR02246 family)
MPANSPEEVDTLVAKALSSRDIEGVMALYEDDAVFIPPGEPVSNALRGKAAIREGMPQFFAMNPTLDLQATKVVEVGDVALVTGDWTLKGTGPEGDVSLSGTYVDVMRRQPDGTWLFVIDNPDGVA